MLVCAVGLLPKPAGSDRSYALEPNSRWEAQEDIDLELSRYNGSSQSQTDANGLTSCPCVIRVLNV